MRPLRYSINVTLDGCCDHQGILPDEDLQRHAMENIARADALTLDRVDWNAELVSRLEFASGAVAMRYEPRR